MYVLEKSLEEAWRIEEGEVGGKVQVEDCISSWGRT